MSNLLRTPGRCPSPILPRSMSTTFPRDRRPGNRSPLWRDDHAGQPILHIRAQRHVDRQFHWFWTLGRPVGMPLRYRCTIVQASAARRDIASQLQDEAVEPSGKPDLAVLEPEASLSLFAVSLFAVEVSSSLSTGSWLSCDALILSSGSPAAALVGRTASYFVQIALNGNRRRLVMNDRREADSVPK